MHVSDILIITADQRLGSVLAAEMDACGTHACIVTDIQSIALAQWEQVRLVIVDLDSRISGAIPEQVHVLGLCRDPEKLPLRLRRMAHMLFRRPFRMADLRAEVSDLLTDTPRAASPAPVRNEATTLLLLEDSRCALLGNRQISLSEKEFSVLSLLIEKGEQGVSKQELSALLDAEQTNEGQVYICHLRKKLEQAFDFHLIKTVRNYGYKYTGIQAKNTDA